MSAEVLAAVAATVCVGALFRKLKGAVVLSQLENLPVGMQVIHKPGEVRSIVGSSGTGWPYRWVFRTEVHAIDHPLTVLRFGICAWDGSKWILPASNRRYNAGVLNQRAFKQWYSCPGARIEPGKPAIDPHNWAGSRTRAPFKQKWFFIGKDDQGKRFKGESVVELLASDLLDDSI